MEAAKIIAADPTRYPGLPLEWANRIFEKENGNLKIAYKFPNSETA
jgi:hypothetical protein